MMAGSIRKAVLLLDPLKSAVKTELIREDGTREVRHIPGDALLSGLEAHTQMAPVRSGLLPPGVVSLTAYPDGWDVTHGLVPQDRVSGFPAASPFAAVQNERRDAERFPDGGL